MRSKSTAVVGLLAGAIGVGAALIWFQERRLRIDSDDAALVSLGRQIYAVHCASCHGGNLEGQPDWKTRKPNGRMPAPPHDASGHTWHHPDEQLVKITKHGVAAVVPGYESDMPAFANVLSDREIRAVLAFIKSSWPADIRSRQEGVGR